MRNSLNVGALTAGALLASGAAAQASPTMTSTDNVGALNGTQAVLPIQAPVSICGNAVAAGGAGFAACDGGAAAALDPEWRYDYYLAQSRPGQSGPSLVSTGNTGIGNGTQVYAPVQVPVDVCGNAVSVLGAATGSCTGGASADHGSGKDRDGKDGHGYRHGSGKDGHGSRDGSGKDGHGSRDGKDGYRYQQDKREQRRHPKAEVVATSAAGPVLTSTGNVGLLNGTQALIPIQLPINVCGNAIAVLGTAQAGCEGGASATNHR